MGMVAPVYWTAEMVRRIADRFTKRHRHQDAGVPLYRIVDGDTQRVDVWTPDAELPMMETARLAWRPAGARQALADRAVRPRLTRIGPRAGALRSVPGRAL